MLSQLIPDLLAPAMRISIRVILYVFRMIAGAPLILPIIFTALIIGFVAVTKLVQAFFYSLYKGIQKNNAEIFAHNFKTGLEKMNPLISKIWDAGICNKFFNGYMWLISKIGGKTGTGSLHRSNWLKKTGFSGWYEKLTHRADTNSENLCTEACRLTYHLEKTSTDALIMQKNTLPFAQEILPRLVKYDKISQKSLWRRHPIRKEQLERLSSVCMDDDTSYEYKTQKINIILEKLDNKDRLSKCVYLKQNYKNKMQKNTRRY